jgi:DNA topoisomerase VI subunit A
MSARMGLEAFNYAVPIQWIGLRASQIWTMQIPLKSFVPLSEREKKLLDNLLEYPSIRDNTGYSYELQQMQEISCSVELQALNWYQ